MSAAALHGDAAHSGVASVRRIAMLATLIAGAVGTMLAATVVNVVLPSIIGAFALGHDQAQWLASAFLVSSTSAMLANTWAMSAFGARASFVAAMVVFIAGSAVGAMADTLPALIAGRVLQGAGAGLIQPMAMILIFRTFADRERGLMIGLYALGVILPPAMGPLVGGYLADAAGWRVVFAASAPVALGAIPLGLAFLPGRATAEPSAPLDIVGLLLASTSLALVLQWMATGHRAKAARRRIVRSPTFAMAALIACLAWTRRQRHPVLRLDLFAVPGFAAAACCIFASGVAVYGSTYLIPLFAQMVQGYSPTRAGEMLAPAGIVMIAAFPVAGWLSDRMPPPWLATAGAVVFAGSMLLLSQATTFTSFAAMAGVIAAGRFAIGVMLPPIHASAMRCLDPALLPAAAPMATFLTQAGGALGVGALAVLVQERAAFHADALVQAAAPDTVTLAIATAAEPFKRLGMVAEAAHHAATGEIAARFHDHAQLLAFRDAFLVLAAITAGLLAPILLGPPPSRAPKSALSVVDANRIDEISSTPESRS